MTASELCNILSKFGDDPVEPCDLGLLVGTGSTTKAIYIPYNNSIDLTDRIRGIMRGLSGKGNDQ
jgi:hypothetical protein